MRSGSASGAPWLRRPHQPPAAATRIPQPRGRRGDHVPPWPETLIEPTVNEQVRWAELWSSPQAAQWAEPGHRRLVATLVRLEVRCRQPLPTEDYLAELDRLRCELGLNEGIRPG